MTKKKEKSIKNQVYDRLKTVMDPELNVDIVSLGLIYDVEYESEKIKITMTLTTPGCPLAPVIDRMIRDSVFDLVDDAENDVIINLTFDPPWVIDMMDEAIRLELGL